MAERLPVLCDELFLLAVVIFVKFVDVFSRFGEDTFVLRLGCFFQLLDTLLLLLFPFPIVLLVKLPSVYGKKKSCEKNK